VKYLAAAIFAAGLLGAAPPANFGSPPSGPIPILFNDHHVYSKPDLLKQGRVLAALVKDGTLLVPLRSMFEQMGATVAYDANAKTVTVSKSGTEVEVTIGKPEVVINGESRPLDVPPMIYKGVVMVPVRVISEGMGAYVQWVAERHIVAVRYVPATPPPSPPASAPPPPPPPPPPPTPMPAATPYRELYVAGDYVFSPKVYNEFSPGNVGNNAWSVRGAAEFTLGRLPLMVEGSYEQFGYPHNCTSLGPPATPNCLVTILGGGFQAPVASFTARDSDVDARLAVRVFNPHVYFGAGYLWRSTSYGYPNQSGAGFGLEKLPDLNLALSFYGSIWYYPSITGTYTAAGASLPLSYGMLKYQLGLDYVIAHGPVFLDAGWMGDGLSKGTNAPAPSSAQGPFAGLGIKF
jgi:hypothetical protein